MLFLACDAVQLGEGFPKFQRHSTISEDDGSTTFLRGARKHSPIVDNITAETTRIFRNITTI